MRNVGTRDYGVLTLADATSSSINTVYAQLSEIIGPPKVAEVAHRLGIQSELPQVLSIVLGTGAVSPLEMASAYSNFATNGQWAAPYIISRIISADSRILYEHEVEHQSNGDPAAFAAARIPLVKVPSPEGTASRAFIGRPQGGKTGTHQGFRDAWYVGFVPTHTTAVWVGYEHNQIPLENVVIGGEHYRRVYGGTVPAPIWAEFMEVMLEDAEVTGFPPDPPGLGRYRLRPNTSTPQVVGLDLETAKVALVNARLNWEIVDVDSAAPAGEVLSQQPPPAHYRTPRRPCHSGGFHRSASHRPACRLDRPHHQRSPGRHPVIGAGNGPPHDPRCCVRTPPGVGSRPSDHHRARSRNRDHLRRRDNHHPFQRRDTGHNPASRLDPVSPSTKSWRKSGAWSRKPAS